MIIWGQKIKKGSETKACRDRIHVKACLHMYWKQVSSQREQIDQDKKKGTSFQSNKVGGMRKLLKYGKI